MEGEEKPIPAGWYADPDDGALQRFWDGSRWTSSRMPRNEAVPLEGTTPSPTEVVGDGGAPPPSEHTGLPPAAWYADPDNAEGMRYWDGSRWTEHRTDYRAAAPKPKASEGMVAAGYILAFLFPVAGVVIGVMLIGRGNRNGRWVLALSALVFLGFVIVGNLSEASLR
jgi:hypothetical protein